MQKENGCMKGFERKRVVGSKNNLSCRTTSPSSSRSVSGRDIEAAPTLYSALRHCGMTSVGGGFTLIELLVVVLIIGILAAIALPQYQLAVEKTRATEAVQWARRLAEAEELYYLANGTYTTDWEALGVTKPQSKYFNFDTAIDSTTYNIYLARLTGDYRFRYFMHHIAQSYYRGRFICTAKLDNKLGTQVCRSLSKDSSGWVYPWSEGDGQAYELKPRD